MWPSYGCLPEVVIHPLMNATVTHSTPSPDGVYIVQVLERGAEAGVAGKRKGTQPDPL